MVTLLWIVLTLLVAYSAIYVGLFLGLINPEEMKPGKKYLVWAKKGFYIVFLLALIYTMRHLWISLLLLFGTYFLFGITHKRWMFTIHEFVVTYPILVLMVSKSSSSMLILCSSLFIYLLICGTLLVIPFTEKKKVTRPMKHIYHETFILTKDFFSLVGIVAALYVAANFGV
ncbi:MAG TPA: hypothetical protein VK158_06420 [Acidobacteriota bacterium]|nr:hypothetical protein [Acidobacteriota bacterium]